MGITEKLSAFAYVISACFQVEMLSGKDEEEIRNFGWYARLLVGAKQSGASCSTPIWITIANPINKDNEGVRIILPQNII